MTITLNGTTGITNDGGYTGDGVVFADSTPSNTLVTTTGGNVGIAVSSPAAKLDVLGDIFARASTLRFKDSGNTTQYGAIYGDSTTFNINSGVNNLIMYSAGTERMRIDSSGNLVMASRSGGGNTGQLQVGTTSILGTSVNSYGQFGGDSGTPYPLGVKGNSSSQGMVGFFDSANSVIGSISKSGSSVAYNTSSDYRLKENIAPMVDALAKVSALKPVTYTWKADGSNGQGFIAHELAEVCPDAVTGEKDAVETYTDEDGNEQTRIKPQGIDTSFLVATLTAAIQEQQAIITAQASAITALEARLTALEQA